MQQYFNPRSPHGERRRCEAIPAICSAFQSTLPAWGATPRSKFIARIRIISIHAPRMGSDLQAKCDSAEADVFQSTPPPAWGATITRVSDSSSFSYFNPRPPHGERRNRKMEGITPVIFQSTLSHGERPIVTIEMVKQFSISIHAPAWGATANTTVLREVIQISIHAPAWGAT